MNLKIVIGTTLLLAAAGCSGPVQKPTSAELDSGIQNTGSAGTQGGAAAVPPGVGVVGTTRVR